MSKRDAITNMDDEISWYQIQERIKWLELDEDDASGNFSEDDKEELANLRKLEAQFNKDECDNEPTLIRDTYFKEYTERYAEEVDAIPRNMRNEWPMRCIDWDQAARELQQDYSQCDFNGMTYWYRA